jgi:hypothetical protein
MDFPRLMYREGAGLALPRGQSVSYKLTRDQEEYAANLKDGWFPSVPEALAGKLDAPIEKPNEVTREAMEETERGEAIPAEDGDDLIRELEADDAPPAEQAPRSRRHG